jgi:tagatose-6-phosphate ketose/aldose isomerase
MKIGQNHQEKNLSETLCYCPELAALLVASPKEQENAGYYHTLKEILQQPDTWMGTCSRMISSRESLLEFLKSAGIFDGRGNVILTGSGSSAYAAECLALTLQRELRISAQVVPAGSLLTHPEHCLPDSPGVLISLARSGDSPESRAVVQLFHERFPRMAHLIITCNPQGQLAQTGPSEAGNWVKVLDEATNDRSLVMTSSFTNMVWAARFLGLLNNPELYRAHAQKLYSLGQHIFEYSSAPLAALARTGFASAIYLGSDLLFGASRESALKMVEMNAGRIFTLAETYLGLRHGPMSAINSQTLLVCYLSADPLVRAYEYDLIDEMNRKELGQAKLLVGDNIPSDLVGPHDVVCSLPDMYALGDGTSVILYVVIGQLLAFFRCLREGLKPDSPSEGGIINRVVNTFVIHSLNGK